jgi:hypothetical protein
VIVLAGKGATHRRRKVEARHDFVKGFETMEKNASGRNAAPEYDKSILAVCANIISQEEEEP